MKTLIYLPLIALVWAAPALAQSQGGFSLPPNPTPTATPEVQGPVDDSGAVPVGPRIIPTGAPTRAAPGPTPAPTPSPTSPQPSAAPTPTAPASPQPTARPPAAVPTARPTDAAPPNAEVPIAPAPIASDPAPAIEFSETVADTSASRAPTGAGEPADVPQWWWIAALAALLAVCVAGFAVWRRKQSNKAAPAIVKPTIADAEPGSEPAMAPATLDQLGIEVEAIKLSRSVMASTLSFRVTLTNRGANALRHIELHGDLTSAHGRAPLADQMADTNVTLPAMRQLDHLGPGQRQAFSGELRLPLKEVRPLRQGSVPIYVPLLRIKVTARGTEAKAHTFVIGKQPAQPGGRLQPFRLDTPPQSLGEIAARPL